MLVTSSQSSTQRPLGLSFEETYALNRQYRGIEQQQQHLTQLQTQTRFTPSNLNRVSSRSLDLVSAPNSNPLPVLPSLEIHGHAYSNRPQTPSSSSSIHHYPRSHSIDQLRQIPTALPPPPKLTYPHRPSSNDPVAQHYHPRYRTYLQPPTLATGPAPTVASNFMYNMPSSSSNDYYDSRNSCKLRRQHPVKREPSRRILVRPVVQRRREPSISSSCESLDEPRSPVRPIPTEQSNFSSSSVSFTPSSSLITNVIENLEDATARLPRPSSHNESLSDENDVNLYEMRISIGKTYDTSDISVQLEGPKILVYCHTIEPTDKRGNYRKHEFKTELIVPDVVDDETIVAYLTEDGQLIVEAKYQAWAWREIQQKRRLEQQEANATATPVLSPPVPPNPGPAPTRNDGGQDKDKAPRPPPSNQSQRTNHPPAAPPPPPPSASANRIEKLDNNRTMIHVGEPAPAPLAANNKTVSDIINRFNTLNGTYTPSLWDGQYSFTNDISPVLHYHVRLPLEASMDSVRIQPEPHVNILRVYSEPHERPTSVYEQQSNRLTIRSIPRICRLPRDFTYDYTHLRVIFLRDNFIRIEVPTLN